MDGTKRLKKIKKSDIAGFEKQVVDSLITTKTSNHKEEKEEKMRCKVEIYEGTRIRVLTDSFILNTNMLSETIKDIEKKYGSNVQFVITNLYDEKVVSKAFVYVGGYNKEKDEREHFNKRMLLVDKIHTYKYSGKSELESCDKFASYAARSYISKIYNMNRLQVIEMLRIDYNNPNLGKGQENVLSEDLNTKEDNINISNLEGENDDE